MRLLANRKKQRGFTTVEVMIAASVTTVFAGAFYGAFHVMNAGMWSSRVYFDTNNSVKVAMDRMARDVEEGIRVETQHDFGNGAQNTGTTTLILRLPSIDATGTPTSISTNFDFVMYRFNAADSTLRRSVDVLNGTSRNGGVDANEVVVARNVNGIVFSNPATNTNLGQEAAGTITAMHFLNVQVTAQGRTLNQNQSTMVDSDMMLRNNIN